MKKKKKVAKAKDIYEQPHVYIATPAYDGKVDTDFAQSLAQGAQAATMYGIRMTAAVMGNGAFIDLARNMFVKFFLEDNTTCTHLLFIDSDLKFEDRALVEVVRHCTAERPVVAGAYRRRQDPESYPLRWVPDPDLMDDGIEKLWYDKAGFLMCDRVPTGFLCIRRNIVESMAAKAEKIQLTDFPDVPKLFYTYIDDETRFVGEDFAWCDDYKKQYGKPISVWADFDFIHAGYECNYQRWIVDNAVMVDKEHSGVAILKEEPKVATRRIGKR